MLSMVGCSIAPLASTHEVPVAPCPPVGTPKMSAHIAMGECLQVSPGGTITWLRTSGLEVCEDR